MDVALDLWGMMGLVERIRFGGFLLLFLIALSAIMVGVVYIAAFITRAREQDRITDHLPEIQRAEIKERDEHIWALKKELVETKDKLARAVRLLKEMVRHGSGYLELAAGVDALVEQKKKRA